MNTLISNANQVSREWLSQVLGQDVLAIEVNAGDAANWSQNVRIVATTQDGPKHLFLKMCQGAAFGDSEVSYCAHDYADLPDAPIPKCYDAVYSAELQAYHILMDDLSATHQDNKHVLPTRAYGCAVAAGLATLHAHYWGNPRLSATGHPISPAQIEKYLSHIRPGLQPLLDAVGDDLDAKSKPALPGIFDHHAQLMRARTANPIGFSLVHGDVNPTNVLSPRSHNFERERVYVIDRQPFDWSLTTWLGTHDLSYMMVHWWPTELRREFEADVLCAYHAALVRRGVNDYSFGQLWQDYRLCAVQSLHVAIEWCTSPGDVQDMRWLWLPQLQKAMSAYWDLRCDKL